MANKTIEKIGSEFPKIQQQSNENAMSPCHLLVRRGNLNAPSLEVDSHTEKVAHFVLSATKTRNSQIHISQLFFNFCV